MTEKALAESYHDRKRHDEAAANEGRKERQRLQAFGLTRNTPALDIYKAGCRKSYGM